MKSSRGACQISFAASSQLEFPFLSDRENFLRSIFQPARSGNRLNGPMALDLDFGVLFPASDIHGHVVEGDLLFEELVHLLLNWIFISRLDK